MVEDHITALADHVDGVHLSFGDVPGTAANKPHDDVVCANADFAAAEADPVSGRGLPGDSDEGFLDLDRLLQVHNPGDLKHDDAWTLGLASFPKTAGARVVQI